MPHGMACKSVFPEDTLSYNITNLAAAGPTQVEMSHCPDKGPSICTRSAQSCSVNGVTVATIGYALSSYQPFSYINLVR